MSAQNAKPGLDFNFLGPALEQMRRFNVTKAHIKAAICSRIMAPGRRHHSVSRPITCGIDGEGEIIDCDNLSVVFRRVDNVVTIYTVERVCEPPDPPPTGGGQRMMATPALAESRVGAVSIKAVESGPDVDPLRIAAVRPCLAADLARCLFLSCRPVLAETEPARRGYADYPQCVPDCFKMEGRDMGLITASVSVGHFIILSTLRPGSYPEGLEPSRLGAAGSIACIGHDARHAVFAEREEFDWAFEKSDATLLVTDTRRGEENSGNLIETGIEECPIMPFNGHRYSYASWPVAYLMYADDVCRPGGMQFPSCDTDYASAAALDGSGLFRQGKRSPVGAVCPPMGWNHGVAGCTSGTEPPDDQLSGGRIQLHQSATAAGVMGIA